MMPEFMWDWRSRDGRCGGVTAPNEESARETLAAAGVTLHSGAGLKFRGVVPKLEEVQNA